MTGFMDEPDEGDREGGGGGGDQDVEREQPPRNPGEPEKKDPHRPRSDDERIDEASDESFPASDPPAQP
jgi:hypothetical protein